MKRPHVLVTGAAGFIGSHLVERLLEQRIGVIGIDNFDPFYSVASKRENLRALERQAKATGTSFVFLEHDLLALEPQWLRGYEISDVIHLAAKAGVRPSLNNPEAYLHANVTVTLKLLDFCRASGIRDFIYGSSSSVYGSDTPVPFAETAPADRPISPYAASKRAGELFCSNYAHLYQLRVSALRFFTVFGPRQRPDLAIYKFAKAIAENQPITLYGDGSSSRDYTFVSDIVDGILCARRWTQSQAGGTYEVFNLGGNVATSLRDLVTLLESAMGKKALLRWEAAQPGDVERTLANLEKSGRLLGYQPQVSVPQGITLFAQWFQGPAQFAAA